MQYLSCIPRKSVSTRSSTCVRRGAILKLLLILGPEACTSEVKLLRDAEGSHNMCFLIKKKNFILQAFGI